MINVCTFPWKNPRVGLLPEYKLRKKSGTYNCVINQLSSTDGIFINRKSMLWKTTSFMMCLKPIMFHSINQVINH